LGAPLLATCPGVVALPAGELLLGLHSGLPRPADRLVDAVVIQHSTSPSAGTGMLDRAAGQAPETVKRKRTRGPCKPTASRRPPSRGDPWPCTACPFAMGPWSSSSSSSKTSPPLRPVLCGVRLTGSPRRGPSIRRRAVVKVAPWTSTRWGEGGRL